MMNKKKEPVFAEDWQLSVLKKLHGEVIRPTEEQRLTAAAETGLDELWIRHWFTRQNAKGAMRSKKKKATDARTTPADAGPFVVAPFRLNVKRYTAGDRLQSTRSRSATIAPHIVKSVRTTDDPPTTGSPIASRNWSIEASQTHICERSTSSTPSLSSVDRNTLRKNHAGWTSYSRDPLHNRYPDFSQFFLPGVHEKFHNPMFLPTFDGPLPLPTDDKTNLQDAFSHSTSHRFLPGPPAFLACPVSFTVSLSDIVLQTSCSPSAFEQH